MARTRSRAVYVLVSAAALVLSVAGVAWPGHSGVPKASAQPFNPSTLNRYTLVHGCYEVRTGPGAGIVLGAASSPYRMQATTLGEYLLYGVHQDFLVQTGLVGIGLAATPSRRAEWQVTGTGTTGFTMKNLGGGLSKSVRFVPKTGCADYPEAQVDATGATFTGATPTGPVRGTIDAHTHTTAFEFLGGDWHCGRPWHPYGVAYALPDCAQYEKGTDGTIESFIDYGSLAHPHDTKGWPTFKTWPAPHALAEEGEYWTGLERAWLAGLRIMVVHLVDNEALCKLMLPRRNVCNDMQSVLLQAKDLHALQDYIDAQAGGPGQGFFRIVTDPEQAREVINSGKLAIVMGIEVSDIFNCGELYGHPKCTKFQINSWLSRVWNLGVRSFFPIHKFDNAFGGTKMDAGAFGVLANGGNHLETGNFWDVRTCTGPEHDQEQLTTVPINSDLYNMIVGPLNTLFGGAVLPIYPSPPHCNVRGLTSLGAYLIQQMIARHFIIELDHMDAKSADQTLALLEAAHYSGVVSGHGWDSPEENPRIYSLGGFITPYAGDATSFVADWQTDRSIADPQYTFGIGYGSDMNGLGTQGGPTSAHPISYPFTSFDGGVTFNREVWGQRTFDLNTDGTANYGMYADWLQELQVLAGPQIMNDMFNGAEAYLQMWQRATA
jgi:microsomal dipeptidase-like Zn-dependent dipeptidase